MCNIIFRRRKRRGNQGKSDPKAASLRNESKNIPLNEIKDTNLTAGSKFDDVNEINEVMSNRQNEDGDTLAKGQEIG